MLHLWPHLTILFSKILLIPVCKQNKRTLDPQNVNGHMDCHLFSGKSQMLSLFCNVCVKSIEIVVLEGESTNEKWTIFLGYQGKLIMVLTSAVRLGWLLQKKIFCNSIKQVSLVSSVDVNTIIFWPFWSSCVHKCILLLEFTTISMIRSHDSFQYCTRRFLIPTKRY